MKIREIGWVAYSWISMPIKYICLLDIISFLNIKLIHLSQNEEHCNFLAQSFSICSLA